MRVLFLVGSLEAGGLERHVTRMCLRAKLGGEFEPVVCCLSLRRGRFLSELEAAGVPVFEAPRGWARSPFALGRLASLIRQIAPQVVHSQVNFALAQQWVAVRSAGSPSMCVTERNCYPLAGLARLRRLFQFWFLRLMGVRYTANSEAVARHLAHQVHAAVNGIGVLPNGVDAITLDEDRRLQLRTELGWSEDDTGFAYVARMAAHKGHELFLRSIALLRDRGLSVRACLVGDGPERERLHALTEALKLSSVVTFTGIVTNVEDYLQAADAAVLLSGHEGMPNAVLEAMAAGKAVVCTPVGSVPELLDHGRAGLIVQNATPAQVTELLAQLVSDHAYRSHLGHAASERALAFFGMEGAFSMLLHHYREVRPNV